MYMLGMKKILLLILLFCWPLTAHAWMAKVVSVTDGDTIKVYNAEQGQVKIRLYGIDTPEKAQPYGKAAGKHLASLIAQVLSLRLNQSLQTVMDVQWALYRMMKQALTSRWCDLDTLGYINDTVTNRSVIIG